MAAPLLIIALAAVSVTTALGDTLNHTGRWTPPKAWNDIEIHMALLPGHGPYHSEVMWWTGQNDEKGDFNGGLWGWKPGEYYCTSFPDTFILAPISLPSPDATHLFCSGAAQLADGKLFVAGGTQGGTEFGIRQAYTFNPFSNTWTQADSMSQARWYPTVTTLATGEALVSSGSHYQHLEFFGGLRDNEAVPLDSALFRYGVGENGVADSPVRASVSPSWPEWPSAREQHSSVYFGTATHIFGGRNANNEYSNDYWQLRRPGNPFGSDFDYQWSHFATIPNPPPARRDHCAIPNDSSMIIFGGIAKVDGNDVAKSDVWHLWWRRDPAGWVWTQVTILSSPADSTPGVRCGHVALWRASDRRMLVFGGRASATGAPSDGALYSLTFMDNSLTTAKWEKLSATGPSPRFHAGLGYDGEAMPDTAFLFGGEGADGGQLNDLWRLNVGTLTWTSAGYVAGTPPSPRSSHTATLDGPGRLLYVFGGRAGDDTVYIAHLTPGQQGEQQAWARLHLHAPTLTGHTAIFGSTIYARVPEVWNPTAAHGSEWTRLDDAPHLQQWYPQAFTTGSDEVFYPGPDLNSYKLQLSTRQWTRFPEASTGFIGGSAVMYRPGKIMKCGSRDTDARTLAVGITKHIDLNAGPAAQWVSSQNEMLPRDNHNLVMLPTGKVLVVGGSGFVANELDSLPVLQPELWDPDYNGGQGQWSGDGVLARHAIHRDYHGTALLLPDSRVLIAGGNGDGVNAKKAEIYCPPYLFNSSGGLLARPQIECAPATLNYGQCFKVCTPQAATISSACLIRPAAVTHGFDQNQRYVPLTTSAASNPSQLVVTAPASAAEAPPGYYLLFVVDGASGNSVPSVARWVQLDSTLAACDNTAPGDVSDLVAEYVSQHSIGLSWTAPGDDGSTGTATSYDVRYSGSAISTETNFTNASQAQNEPAPQSAGSSEAFEVTGLSSCTWYHFRMRTYDELCNASGLSNDPGAMKTMCSDGGGGFSAQQAHGDTEGGTTTGATAASTTTGAPTLRRTPIGTSAPGTVSKPPAPLLARTNEATALKPSPGMLVVGTERTAAGGWRINLTSAEASEGSDLPDGAALTVQDRDAANAWHTRSRYASASAEDVLGLSALHEGGRAVLPGGYGLQQVIGALRSGGATYALTAASHSSLGALEVAAIANGGSLSLTAGDSLSLTYEPDTTVAASAEDWYLIAGRGLLMSASRQRRETREAEALPVRFALHQNQPNPFSARTTIRFDLPAGAMVRLEVFDLSGRRVKVLAHHYYPPGYQSIEWDQRSDAGARVGPGVYFYRIDAGPLRDRRKMALTP